MCSAYFLSLEGQLRTDRERLPVSITVRREVEISDEALRIGHSTLHENVGATMICIKKMAAIPENLFADQEKRYSLAQVVLKHREPPSIRSSHHSDTTHQIRVGQKPGPTFHRRHIRKKGFSRPNRSLE